MAVGGGDVVDAFAPRVFDDVRVAFRQRRVRVALVLQPRLLVGFSSPPLPPQLQASGDTASQRQQQWYAHAEGHDGSQVLGRQSTVGAVAARAVRDPPGEATSIRTTTQHYTVGGRFAPASTPAVRTRAREIVHPVYTRAPV